MSNGINKIRQILDQPFPDDNSLIAEIKSSVIIGFFVFMFLFLFKPFGMHRAGSMVALYSAYFGIATSVVSLLANLFIDHILKVDRQSPKWTFGRWLLSVVFVVLLIAFANYFIMAYINQDVSFKFAHFLRIAYTTVLIALFPVGFIGYLHLTKMLRQNEAFAGRFVRPEIDNERKGLVIGKDANASLRIDQEDFLFAEAMQNYLAVYHYSDGELKKDIIRMTLKELESSISNEQIVRCHRSFICNLRNIEEISGNAQGLKLKMKYSDHTVQVSRSYLDLFR